jgi:hypothetical protein
MSLYHSSGFDAQFVLKYFFYFYMFKQVLGLEGNASKIHVFSYDKLKGRYDSDHSLL